MCDRSTARVFGILPRNHGVLYAAAIRVSMLLSLVSGRCMAADADFLDEVQPILNRYCFECHSGDEVNGDVDFGEIKTEQEINESFELWESTVGHLRSHTMPPEDAPQPTPDERERVIRWYRQFVDNIEPQPSVFQPRRLSVTEYRNTLRSVLGFDLEVDVIEAEQTVSQRSMVIKLLPEDPRGKSGFKNDTHYNPLTTVAWDQYSYVVDAALEELFSSQRRNELEQLVGAIDGEHLQAQQASTLIRKIMPMAFRRDVPSTEHDKVVSAFDGLHGAALTSALKLELEAILMSPGFLYRGLRIPRVKPGRQLVDPFELAERLSYFIWADMPDQRLMRTAKDRRLLQPEVYDAEINRMLDSAKASSLVKIFVAEWLSLNEIDHASKNPPVVTAFKTQPIDFVQYLFDEDRPLIELVDSKTAFANRYTAKMYGADAKQLKKGIKERGIEQRTVPNQRIEIRQASYRGGILTMPGVLAMNRGPILRGTWILERILGEELPDPPANIGQVEPNLPGQTLTFRERFEQHRENATCAVCHDKIDPLGFALQGFDDEGKYMLTSDYDRDQRKKKKSDAKSSDDPAKLATNGRLPTGEHFEGIEDLKQILTTTQRGRVIRNIVERCMAYALCRKLTAQDLPVVNSITNKMIETDGTWRELIREIAGCIQFRETILEENEG